MAIYMSEISGWVNDVSDTPFELFRFWEGVMSKLATDKKTLEQNQDEKRRKRGGSGRMVEDSHRHNGCARRACYYKRYPYANARCPEKY